MKKLLLILVLLMVAVAVLAACGRNGDEQSDATPSPPPVTGQETQPDQQPPLDLGILGPHNPVTWTMMIVTDNMPPAADNWLMERIREE